MKLQRERGEGEGGKREGRGRKEGEKGKRGRGKEGKEGREGREGEGMEEEGRVGWREREEQEICKHANIVQQDHLLTDQFPY